MLFAWGHCNRMVVLHATPPCKRCVRLRGTVDAANVRSTDDWLRRLMACGLPSERLDLGGIQCGDAAGAEHRVLGLRPSVSSLLSGLEDIRARA
jgi:hypothetical protein